MEEFDSGYMHECQIDANLCRRFHKSYVEYMNRQPNFESLIDIASNVLIILLANNGISFSVEELAVQMPSSFDIGIFRRSLDSLIQAKDCFGFSMESNKITLKTKCRNSLRKALFKNSIDMPLQLFNYGPSNRDQISDAFNDTLKFYDRVARQDREFKEEERDSNLQMQVYAWPCRFVMCYLIDELAHEREISSSIIAQLKNVNHHYGDYYKVLVANKFNPETISSTVIRPASLITWGDYQRFLDFIVYDKSFRKAPTIDEWAAVFTNNGIGTFVVLDIINNRLKQTSNKNGD